MKRKGAREGTTKGTTAASEGKAKKGEGTKDKRGEDNKNPHTPPPPPPTLRSTLYIGTALLFLLLSAFVYHHYLHNGSAVAEGSWSLARCVRADVGVPVLSGWPGMAGASFFAAIADHRSLVHQPINAIGTGDKSENIEDARLAHDSGGGPVPVVLRHTAMVERWPAFSRWRSVDYLTSLPELKQMKVDVGDNNTFLYVDKGQDMWTQRVPNLPDQAYKTVNMTSAEFFRLIHSVPDGKYYYHYGRVEGSLVADVSPNAPLWRTWDDANRFGLFLWLSGADVRPAIHFDSDHNFFVHLNGSKKFVLFPPWEWENMYLYPRIHPSWHKSQLSFDSVPLETYPKARLVQAYEVLLEPGDVLHVPPYWFHHVESTTPSVSLASWSEFSAHEPMHELFTVNYETMTWRIYSGKDQVIAVKLYIEMLIKKLVGSRSRSFIESVLHSRWPAPMQDLVQATCDRGMMEGLKDDVDISVDCFERLVEPSLKGTRYAQAISDILLADWVELSASEVVGAANTFRFLRDCLYFP